MSCADRNADFRDLLATPVSSLAKRKGGGASLFAGVDKGTKTDSGAFGNINKPVPPGFGLISQLPGGVGGDIGRLTCGKKGM